MNASRPLDSLSAPAARPTRPAALSLRPTERSARDFGVGYGRSSGYAAPRRYAPAPALPRFRFA